MNDWTSRLPVPKSSVDGSGSGRGPNSSPLNMSDSVYSEIAIVSTIVLPAPCFKWVGLYSRRSHRRFVLLPSDRCFGSQKQAFMSTPVRFTGQKGLNIDLFSARAPRQSFRFKSVICSARIGEHSGIVRRTRTCRQSKPQTKQARPSLDIPHPHRRFGDFSFASFLPLDPPPRPAEPIRRTPRHCAINTELSLNNGYIRIRRHFKIS